MTEVFRNDANTVAPGMDSAQNSLPEPPRTTGPVSGVEPEVTSTLDFGNEATKQEITRIIDNVIKVKGISIDTALKDQEGAEKVRDIGGPVTELSSSSSPADGFSALSARPTGQPMMVPMQAMAPLTAMPMQAMGTMSGMSAMPMQAVSAVPMQASSSSPAYSSPGAPYTAGAVAGESRNPLVKSLLARGVNAGRISTGQVQIKKTGLGTLNSQQFRAIIDKALDLNRIPDNPRTRSQWHEVLAFMAKKESAFMVDAAARSGSDYNVQISRGQNGADGEPVHTSRGIFQTVPGTFAQFHVRGTSANIYDPLASAAAAINYIVNDPKYGIDRSGGSELQAFYNSRRRNGYTGY